MLHNWRPDDEGALSPKAPTLTTVRRADPRRRMLDAMIHTVAHRGYDRATVSRVLTRADVAEALFSEHFHNKQDCFCCALDELAERAEQAALARFELSLPWHERMRSGLAALLDWLAHNQDAARVLFVEMLAAGPCAHRYRRGPLELFTALVEQGRSQARHPEDLPPQTSEAIVGGIASIVHHRVLGGETATLPSLLPDLLCFALLPYLGQERAVSVSRLQPAA
jgi:AcrR family transcriptional regulator